MRLLLLLLLPGCALLTPRFNPKSIPERFIDSCFDLCASNPELNISVSCLKEESFNCNCKK